MFIPDDEKDDRKAAIQKLMGMMNDGMGKKLGDLKAKPVAASMTIEKVAPHDEPDADDINDDDGDDDNMPEPSPQEKMMIDKLYHKFCK